MGASKNQYVSLEAMKETAVVLDMSDIKKFKDLLYPGQIIKTSRYIDGSQVDCHARIIDKYPNNVCLEDLEPNHKVKKIFTKQYKELVGRIQM